MERLEISRKGKADPQIVQEASFCGQGYCVMKPKQEEEKTTVTEDLLGGAISFPMSEREFQNIQRILKEIDDEGTGTVMMALRGQPGRVRLFQAYKKDDRFLVNATIGLSNGYPEGYAVRAASLQEAVEAAKDVCVYGKGPTSGKWEKVTKEIPGVNGR